jgi:hypothetical protein
MNNEADVRHKVAVEKFPNPFSHTEGEYIGRVKPSGVLNSEQVAASARNRAKAILSTDAILAGARIFLDEMVWLACDGWSINVDGVFHIRPHFNGIFHSPKEGFDKDKHKISFDLQEGVLLRKEADTIHVEVDDPSATGTVIMQVEDAKTGTVNGEITCKHVLHIIGNKLKIEGSDPSVGVYFIDMENQYATKVDPTDIVANRPSELMILTPQLSDGMYQVRVTTQFAGGGHFLKTPRTDTFETALRVGTGTFG